MSCCSSLKSEMAKRPGGVRRKGIWECARKALFPSSCLDILWRSVSSAAAGSRPSVEAVVGPMCIGGVWGSDGIELSDTESSSSGEEVDEGVRRRMPDPGNGVDDYALVGAAVLDGLFPLCPAEQRIQSSEDVFRAIHFMRGPEFMKDTGFIWATGVGRRSAGKKLKRRFEQSTSFVAVGAVQPMVEELLQYVMPRFPSLASQLSVERFHIDAANRSPQQGRWFKIMSRLAPFTGSSPQLACLGLLLCAKKLGMCQGTQEVGIG